MTVTETRSADLIPQLLEGAEKVSELRSMAESKRGDTYLADLRTAVAEVNALDAEHNIREKAEAREWAQYQWDTAVAAETLQRAKEAEQRSNGPSAAFGPGGTGEYRSFSASFMGSDAFEQWKERGASGLIQGDIVLDGRSLVEEYRMGLLEQRTLLTESKIDTPSAGLLLPVAQPIAPTPRQMRFFLRDLLSVSETGMSAVPYVRELSPASNETGASTVAEGVAKPETQMQFQGDTALVKKIAAWIPATMEVLSDSPTLQGYVFTRLAYMLQVREQAEVLNGNGIDPDLKGILTYSGIQTTGATNDDPLVDFANAMGLVENVDLEADGIAMNPTDYWTTLAQRHSSRFDGEGFSAGGSAPFAGPANTIWGCPVVRTRALTTLTAVVADWRMGATLFDRMQTTIRTSDSHDVFFVANKVAILAEERVALAVFRPDAFVKCTIDITP